MTRPVAVALLLLSILAVAAPVPKRKPAFGPFGDFTDPKTKCKAEIKSGSLTITVPTEQPAVDAKGVGPHRPVIAKSVEGDFTLTVRMTQTLGDKPGRASPKITEAAASGLAVFDEDQHELGVSAVILRTQVAGEWDASRLFGHSIPDTSWGRLENGWTDQSNPVYLRISRRGCEITVETSRDATKWKHFREIKVKGLIGPVIVGPVAFQSTDKEFTATFDEYELKPLAKDEKK